MNSSVWLPGAQSVHSSVPLCDANLPAGHPSQTVLSILFLYIPGGHAEHVPLSPLDLYFPSGQSSHLDDPRCGAIFPSAHLRQSLWDWLFLCMW